LLALQGPLDQPTDPYGNKEKVSNKAISAELLGQQTSNKRNYSNIAAYGARTVRIIAFCHTGANAIWLLLCITKKR